ncbi:hypothetical protein JGA53_25355, partial [Salmonella enterica subsp. enterica serovar Agona]|nr:hypothetical protein [Salmonella enterica subsp. enterica serovar Agona]
QNAISIPCQQMTFAVFLDFQIFKAVALNLPKPQEWFVRRPAGGKRQSQKNSNNNPHEKLHFLFSVKAIKIPEP